MIRLTSSAQAKGLDGRIPRLAVLRMRQFEGEDGRYDPGIHGHIVIIEPGDDIADMPEVSPEGLPPLLDPEEPGYEFLEAFEEDGRTVWEMAVAIDADRTVAVIFAESPALDPRLIDFLALIRR